MIAEVVFDVPIDHPFSYRVPDGWSVEPGQRVLAPLRGTPRSGVVVDVRAAAAAETLKPLTGLDDAAPRVGADQLALARWIAAESLSSLGSTLAALAPPSRATTGRRRSASTAPASPGSDTTEPTPRDEPAARPAASSRTSIAAPAPAPVGGDRPVAPRGERRGTNGECAPAAGALLVGVGRERRLLERLAQSPGPALILAPDVDACARWAHRLDRIERTVRLDSGASDAERTRGRRDFECGVARLAVGTRSALLAAMPAHGTIAVVDEHDPAHRPPGAPRIHAREVALERARREGLGAIFTAATPSVEMWHRAASGGIALQPAPAAGWPSVAVADTRGILRREALTPLLARELREALGAGRRAFLAVSRRASALACDECGAVVRCEACGIALAYARASATLTCRLCSASLPLPDVCPDCRGHRLSPFGWGAERVEHAVRRRFPRARVARYDPEATRGARAEAQRAAAAAADVVIGTRGALRLLGPASLGLAGFVSPDQLLRAPDFRAAEHTLALMWAAAERVGPEGRVVVQSQNPAHYAFAALIHHDLDSFYRQEVEFRRELGYPPFRRLAVITVRGRTGEESERTAREMLAALGQVRGLTLYPPPADVRGRARQVVVKGGPDLPALLSAALRPARASSSRARSIIDVEVDPVQWPS